mgnify:CR=1 FL=1
MLPCSNLHLPTTSNCENVKTHVCYHSALGRAWREPYFWLSATRQKSLKANSINPNPANNDRIILSFSFVEHKSKVTCNGWCPIDICFGNNWLQVVLVCTPRLFFLLYRGWIRDLIMLLYRLQLLVLETKLHHHITDLLNIGRAWLAQL